MARVIQLGRLWILGARRGRGGFGEVFEAVDAAGMEGVVESRPEGLEVALPLGTVGSGGRTRTYDQALTAARSWGPSEHDCAQTAGLSQSPS